MFENDIFGNEPKKENKSRVREDPFAKKDDDDIFGSSIGNKDKQKEKFSLLGGDEPSGGGIGKQPRKMKQADGGKVT